MIPTENSRDNCNKDFTTMPENASFHPVDMPTETLVEEKMVRKGIRVKIPLVYVMLPALSSTLH